MGKNVNFCQLLLGFSYAMSFSEIIYVGEFRRNLDGKNRVTVPAKWRFQGDESEVYIALPCPDGSVLVRPPKEMETFLEKVSAVGSGNVQHTKMLNQIFSMAHSFGCDKQGRIGLNQRLMDQAGIKREVVLLGAMKTFKIWDAQRYDRLINETFTNQSYANSLAEMGL